MALRNGGNTERLITQLVFLSQWWDNRQQAKSVGRVLAAVLRGDRPVHGEKQCSIRVSLQPQPRGQYHTVHALSKADTVGLRADTRPSPMDLTPHPCGSDSLRVRVTFLW
eukprot:5291008-Amphidinium_carterae.1